MDLFGNEQPQPTKEKAVKKETKKKLEVDYVLPEVSFPVCFDLTKGCYVCYLNERGDAVFISLKHHSNTSSYGNWFNEKEKIEERVKYIRILSARFRSISIDEFNLKAERYSNQFNDFQINPEQHFKEVEENEGNITKSTELTNEKEQAEQDYYPF